jgi:hypothetical protein
MREDIEGKYKKGLSVTDKTISCKLVQVRLEVETTYIIQQWIEVSMSTLISLNFFKALFRKQDLKIIFMFAFQKRIRKNKQITK